MDMPIFWMTCGLVASGKSSKAKDLADRYDAQIFSSDALREEMFGDVNDQSNNTRLFNELHRRIKDSLKSGQNAIMDCTNISYKRRMAFLQELKSIPCKKICVLMATPYEECLKRNATRERKVPECIIKRMYMNFCIPYWYEGWDDIRIVYSDEAKGYRGGVTDWVMNVMDYNQCNSHHNLTLGQHCLKAFEYLDKESVYRWEIRTAALIHDCAKPICATYVNLKNEITNECHYYNHQFCGCYESLFFHDIDDHLYVATLIMWHMQPYFNKEEKTIAKYRKLWGEDLYRDVMLLHKADEYAH